MELLQKTCRGQALAAFLSFALLFFSFSSAASADSGTEGASFLDIPVGAAPAALGSAYTARATDAYSPIWNPAGLGFLPGPQLAAQHLAYLESIHYEFASVAIPLRKDVSALGFSMQYLGSGDIAGTTTGGTSTGDYSSHYAAYSVAYGQRLSENLSLGLTGKMIEAKIQDTSAMAFAGDAGMLYRARPNLQLAATVVNFGNQLKFDAAGDDLPLAFHAGAAYLPHQHWALSVEGVYSKTGLFSGRTGIEWKPMSMLALRAGYKTDTMKELSALAGFTTGVGIAVWGQELAYAWLPYGDLGDTHYLSLVIKFGERERERRNLIHFQKNKTYRNAGPAKADDSYQQLIELMNTTEPHVVQKNSKQRDSR